MKWVSLRIVYLLVSSLHKNEIMFQAKLPFVLSLRKNETYPLPLIRVFPLVLELEPSFNLPDSHSSYPHGEHFHISNQVFRLGMEEESLDKMRLAGHIEPLATMLGVSFTRNHAGGKIPTSVYHVNGIFSGIFYPFVSSLRKNENNLQAFFQLIFELVKNSKMVLSLLFIFRALVKT